MIQSPNPLRFHLENIGKIKEWLIEDPHFRQRVIDVCTSGTPEEMVINGQIYSSDAWQVLLLATKVDAYKRDEEWRAIMNDYPNQKEAIRKEQARVSTKLRRVRRQIEDYVNGQMRISL